MFPDKVPVCLGREALVYLGNVASFLAGTPKDQRKNRSLKVSYFKDNQA